MAHQLGGCSRDAMAQLETCDPGGDERRWSTHWRSRMHQEDRVILTTFASRVRERFPEARVWAFGSRARGGAGWDSDFDICVVVDRLDAKTDQTLSDLAWEVGFVCDRVITVVPFSREAFERGPFSESTLVETIRREGIAA